MNKLKQQQPNDDNTVIIGNKPEMMFDQKTNQYIPTEPYLRIIISYLGQYGYVYLKVVPHPEKIARVNQIYELLRWIGIYEMKGDRKFIYVDGWQNKELKEKVKVMLIKWQMIPRMVEYRESLLSEIKEEKSE